MLALQGAFAAHQLVLERLGVRTVAVRQPKHLDGVDALVLPGGESTTMSKLAVSTGLFEPLAERLAAGMAAFGTCAGAIMLATGIAEGRADQRDFATLDIDVRRNGYGRQIDSFETDMDIPELGAPPVHAVAGQRLANGVELAAAHAGEGKVVQYGALDLDVCQGRLDPRLRSDLRGTGEERHTGPMPRAIDGGSDVPAACGDPAALHHPQGR